MKLLKSTLYIASLGSFALPNLSYANQGVERKSKHENRKGHRHGQGMFENLNLSDEQRNKVKAIREAKKTKHQTLRQEINAAEEALREAQKSGASKDEILKHFDTVSDLKKAMGRMRIEGMLEIREILTPEQREKAQGLMEKRKGRHEGQRGTRMQKRKSRGNNDS